MDYDLWRPPLLGWRNRDRSAAASRPEPGQRLPWGGLWSSAGHSPQPVPGSPSSPADPEVGGPGGPWGEGCSLPHIAHSALRTPVCPPCPISISFSLMSICLVWVLSVLEELDLPFPSNEDKRLWCYKLVFCFQMSDGIVRIHGNVAVECQKC